ncbi:MAG: phasin family protein [Vicinamibacteria bacterium]|nr:phasin family protein [Vicinamibacteria bacterium]
MPPKKSRKSAKKMSAKGEPVKVVHGRREALKTAKERVEALIESGKPALERAQAFASETGRNLSKQTKAIRKDIAHRVSDLGVLVEKERKSLGRKVEGAVKTTLASLNIPTRSEINLLAKRVEELSRKIDSLKRR